MKGIQRRIKDTADGWAVEESLSSRPNRTRRRYYYKGQLAIRLELTTPAAHTLAGFILIEKDIRTLKRWLSLLRAILETLGAPAGQTATTFAVGADEHYYLARSLYVSVVTTYGKMFTGAEGRGPSLDRSSWVVGAEHLETHEHLIHTRNTFAAHSGIDSPEGCQIVVAIDYSRKNRVQPKLYSELHQPGAIGLPEVEAVTSLLDAIQEKVASKIAKASKFLDNETQASLTPEKLKRLRKGAAGALLTRKNE